MTTMRNFQLGTLLAATITTGLMAGLFAAFGYAVMPGLHRSGDRSYVEVMQNINGAILNPFFMLCFMGALALIALASVLAWRGHGRSALPWLIAALVLYGVLFLITSGINVPLNDRLEQAGDPAHIANLAAVRDNFETRWVAWNIARAVANVAAFAALTWALVLCGRETADQRPGAAQSRAGTSADLSNGTSPGATWMSLEQAATRTFGGAS